MATTGTEPTSVDVVDEVFDTLTQLNPEANGDSDPRACDAASELRHRMWTSGATFTYRAALRTTGTSQTNAWTS